MNSVNIIKNVLSWLTNESTAYYPPAAFYFSVSVGNSTDGSAKTDIDGKFQEVSGITVEFNTEEVAEGGENRFKHKLPSQAKYPNLTLKRGAVTISSALADWCAETLGTRFMNPIKTKTIKVNLLNEKGAPSLYWTFYNVYPVKWDVSGMNSQENKILIETLEFSYNYFVRGHG